MHAGQETRGNPPGLVVFVSVDAAPQSAEIVRRPRRKTGRVRDRPARRSPTTGRSRPGPRSGARARRRPPRGSNGLGPTCRAVMPAGRSVSIDLETTAARSSTTARRPARSVRPSRPACSSAFAAARSASAPRFPAAPAIACACLAAAAPSPAATAARRASSIWPCPSANRSSIRSSVGAIDPETLAACRSRRCPRARTPIRRAAPGLAIDAR